MEKTSILFVIYDLEPAGPEIRLLDLARRLPPDLAMHVCVLSRRQKLRADLENLGVPVWGLPLSRGYLAFGGILRLRRYIRAHGIDVLSLYDGKGMILALGAKLLGGGGVRMVFNAVSLMHNFIFRQRLLLGMLFFFMDKLICNSRRVGIMLNRFRASKNKTTLIYNGVDGAIFDPGRYDKEAVRAKLGFGPRDLVLGALANFKPVKNYPFLLQSFARLGRSLPRLRLLCVGGGDDLEKTKELARSLGVKDKVCFTGLTNQPARYLAAMDIFACCSLFEGFPNSLLQALAMGLPAVSADVGGCGEMVDPGKNGFLYPSGDAAAFESYVARLAHDPALRTRMAETARQTALERFSVDKMADAYVRFFRELAKGG